MKKILILISLFSSLCAEAYAENKAPSNTKDRLTLQLEYYATNGWLSKNTVISFGRYDGRINIESLYENDGEVAMSYKRHQVAYLTFGNSSESGIVDVAPSTGREVSATLNGDLLTIDRATPGSEVKAYGVDGRCFGTAVASGSGNASMQVRATKAVLIVKTSEKTLKIFKK